MTKEEPTDARTKAVLRGLDAIAKQLENVGEQIERVADALDLKNFQAQNETPATTRPTTRRADRQG